MPAEQRHGPVRVDDDGRAVEWRCDHQRVFEANPPEDVTSVRAERDGENLVRGLGRDDRDGPVRPKARADAAGTSRSATASSEESAHAIDTANAKAEVPVSYGFPAPGAWRSLVSALVWGTKGRRFESGRPD